MIFDTNALSAIVEADPGIEAVASKIMKPAIPVIVLGEYLFGINQSRFRARYKTWLDTFLPLFELLPITSETCRRYAEVRLDLKRIGRPIPSNDVWIAALALQYGYPILSQDMHMEGIPGVQRVGW